MMMMMMKKMKMKSLASTAPPPKLISTPPLSINPPRRFINIFCCTYNDTEEKPRHALNRRQLLLASSVRVPAVGGFSQPRDQLSNLTDYRKLDNAQKLNYKYGVEREVASSLFRASDPCNGVHDEFSGVVSVPSQRYHAFVEARVERPHVTDRRHTEEELVIDGIKVTRQSPFWFDVFIRPADVEAQNEYVGSFLHTPRHRKGQPKGLATCSLMLGIGDVMDDVDPHHLHSTVVVTLAAKLAGDLNSIDLHNIRIQC